MIVLLLAGDTCGCKRSRSVANNHAVFHSLLAYLKGDRSDV